MRDVRRRDSNPRTRAGDAGRRDELREDHFGEQYAQAIDGTRAALGLSPSRIANAQWVYKKIEPSRRRERLTYSHYELIAPLPIPEQEELMDRAESEDLSTHALRKLVVERHPTTSRGKERAGEAVEGEEGLRSACSKACEWLSEHERAMTLEQIAKWRGPIEFLYDFFRRHWYK